MAVIDRINRRGDNSKQIIIGPAELIGPIDGGRKGTFASVTRITGLVDLYEISDGMGANEGTYTIRVRPFSERGMRASLGGIGRVALVLQPNGVNNSAATPFLVGMKAPADRQGSVVIGPASITTSDRLYIAVERKDLSTLKYQLEVDLILDAITFTAQPTGLTVTAPAATSFTVGATTNDGGVLSYQWQLSTDGGVTFANVANGGVYSGATTNTLSIANTTGLDGRRVRVAASSSGGAPTLLSGVALLSVLPEPLITVSVQPQNLTVNAPNGLSLGVTATSNDNGVLSYQWQVSTDNGVTYVNVANGGVYSGALTANLAVSDSTGLDGYRYRVLINSSGAAPSVTSATATLTVIPASIAEYFANWVDQNYGWLDMIAVDWWGI